MLVELVDIACELSLNLLGIYAEVLSLGSILLFRLPVTLFRAPLSILFPRWFRIQQKQFKSIFITGASVGIGAGLAKEFASPHTHLWITARSLESLEKTKAECEAKGSTVTCLAVDVRDKESMQRSIQLAHHTQRLDLVIANAGMAAQLNGLSEAHLVLETNVMGMCNTICPALELMLKEERSASGYSPQLVLMSSLGGLGPSGSMFMAPYAASKNAIRVYGESLRYVLGDKHIGVTVIAPGMTESRMVSRQTEQGIRMQTGVWSIDRALALMRRGICENHAEVAYPFAWYAFAKTFFHRSHAIKDFFSPLTRIGDPYHVMDRFHNQ